ncbi:hypothetical protein GCM10010252_77790 [Streptomyces aureoverticillatus]|nr:hypothetical protein GCM10010252_77790 [Streptomyces aureoverticillatus]
MKAEKDYLIGAVVVIETDCLLLFGMIINCSMSDIIMLRWIVYIKSLNPEFKHITGKDNLVADMLSRARYEREDEMVEDIDDVGLKFYLMLNLNREDKLFFEEFYEGELLDIGHYLNTLFKQGNWFTEKFK